MAKIRSVSSLYLRLTLGLSTLIVILVGATMIVIDTRQHNLIVDQVSQSVSKQLKDAMSHQVSSAVTLINKVHEEETYRLKTQLAQQVRQAHQQASKILENNSDLPLSRKNELIIDTLRPIQFNGGRGSIFIADSKGELKLSPQIEYHHPPSSDSDIISPEEHSQLLSNTIHQVKMQDELFVEGLSPDFTDIPNSLNEPTVGFYKYLEPLGWIIGSKESIHAFEETAKQHLMGILSKLETNEQLRLFIADEQLNLLALSNRQSSETLLRLYDVLPENKEIIDKAIQLARNGSSEAIKVRWFDLKTQSYKPILLYMRLEPNWKWLIGSFVAISDIEQEIGLKKTRLADRIEQEIIQIAAILVLAYLISIIIGLLVYRKIKWHFNLFIERLQSAAHENHPISDDMISIEEFDTLAKTMNEQLAKRAELQLELEHLAQKDPLSNLYNRRKMDEILTTEVARTKRNNRPFCLILCDIDHFKRVNDTYGHETGDKVICVVANMLRTSLRQQDSVARWGGEEFLIALPDTHMEQAVIVADKIRTLCESCQVSDKGQNIRFTLTLGVEEFTGVAEIKAAIAAADHALYEGKQQGRNIVVRSKPN